MHLLSFNFGNLYIMQKITFFSLVNKIPLNTLDNLKVHYIQSQKTAMIYTYEQLHISIHWDRVYIHVVGWLSVCYFAWLFRPVLPALLFLPSTSLLMGLQLLQEIIQDLLGWHGGHIHNVLLQKRYLYHSLSSPAVTTHMGLWEVWGGVGMVSALGRLLLALRIERLCSSSITGSHFLTDGSADVGHRERWAVARLVLAWETAFSSYCRHPLFKRHKGRDPL